MADPIVLGPDGKPVRLRSASRVAPDIHIFGPTQPVDNPVLPGMTPARLAGILAPHPHGAPAELFTLYSDLEQRDLVLSSLIQQRKLHVLQLPLTIVPVAKDPGDAELEWAATAMEWLGETDEFAEIAFHLLDGIQKGYAVVEPLWDRRVRNTDGARQLRVLAAPYRVDQRHTTWDAETQSVMHFRDGGGMPGKVVPNDGTFVKMVARDRSDLPSYRGLLRPIAIMCLLKSLGLRDMFSALARFGIPVRYAQINDLSVWNEKNRAQLRRILASMSGDLSAIVPPGVEMQVHNTLHSGDLPHPEAVQMLNRYIARAELGHSQVTDTEDGHGNRSLGETGMSELTAKLIRADAKLLQGALQKVLDLWLAVNAPAGLRLRVAINAEPQEDQDLVAARAKALHDMGVPLALAELYERCGFRQPEDGEEVLDGASAPAPSADPRDEAEAEAPEDGDAAESEANATALRTVLADLMPWRPMVREAVKASSNPSELRTALETQAADKRIHGRFANAMSRGTVTARVDARSKP